MTVRKSLADWYEAKLPGRVSARAPQQRAILEALVGEANAPLPPDDATEPVPVTAMEYAVWIAVSAARADASFDLERPEEARPGTAPRPLTDLLLDEFGTEETIGAALEMYYSVEDRCRQAQRRTGKSPRPEPPTVDPDAERKQLEQMLPTRERMGTADILRYSAERAIELGFSPHEVWAKEQGRRHGANVKDARAQIVLELRERNATLPDIGAVFGGRKKESIHALVQRARANRKEK